MVEAFPYQALTFDCYGTLVDWRRGMQEALAAIPELAGCESQFGALVEARIAAEKRIEAGAFLRYSEVLAQSLTEACAEVLDLSLPATAAQSFAAAQAHWPAFADTVAALRRLAPHVRLCLLSNSDTDTLQRTADVVLEGAAEALVSAEQVRSYKPAPAHFEAALAQLELEPAQVLHVSAYPYYDLIPAHALGFRLGFVARDETQKPPADMPLAASTADLAGLADLLGA